MRHTSKGSYLEHKKKMSDSNCMVKVFYMFYRDLLKKLFIMTLGKVTIFLGLDNPDAECVSWSSLIHMCRVLPSTGMHKLKGQPKTRGSSGIPRLHTIA